MAGGVHDQSWRDLIVPAAFAHPAKMARGLLERIITHLFDCGVERGSLVLDPFGGIGTTAIIGASHGLRVVCCELEPKFVELARQNIEKWRRDWEAMGLPQPIIIQGDSRYLRTALTYADAVVSSPPYAAGGMNDHKSTEAEAHQTHDQARDKYPGWCVGKTEWVRAYGNSEGQLGMLKNGDGVEAVISSPPYAEIATGAGGLNTKPPQHEGQQGGRSSASASQDTDQRYGDAEGQLARLPKGAVDAVVSSPPFTQGYSGGGGINLKGYGPDGADKVGDRTYQGTGAEREPGNLETLTLGDVEAVVSSPPYEGSLTQGNAADGYDYTRYGGGGQLASSQTYGSTEGQLGAEQGETFWTAAQQVVQETFALLKPGGYAVWVVKAFVRNKKLVDFPGDWRRLCEHAGFDTIEEIHASLVQETTHAGLFGEMTTKKERKSFFRRLAEKKGSPKIDFEVVWVMRKPA